MKDYINIFIFTITLAWSVIKFHYGIYSHTECKSQTIYMHNIDTHF
jgi:hypothetical protein